MAAYRTVPSADRHGLRYRDRKHWLCLTGLYLFLIEYAPWSRAITRVLNWSLQVIYMTGWREHPSQQKAKRRGSATVSFQDIQKHLGSNS